MLDSTPHNSTIRTMQSETTTLLGYALLGLIQQKPASGYDLRKIFAETPMGTFSDSPGAIYPALRRLEQRRLVLGSIEAGSGLRRRKVLRLTVAGLAALKKWLGAPITQDDLSHRSNELMLRFAFLDQVMGEAATLRFLRSIEAELRLYIPGLKAFLKSHGAQMPTSGKLALESGVLGYEAQLRWAARAVSVYEEKVKPK